jgi:hypothetical protein
MGITGLLETAGGVTALEGLEVVVVLEGEELVPAEEPGEALGEELGAGAGGA